MNEPPRRVTPGEYLAFERASEERHEYRDGEVVAMEPASREHSLIAGRFCAELGAALSESACEVHGCGMRIKIAARGWYVYADALIACGEPALEDEERDTLLDPVVVVEVLSDASEAYDRGAKFAAYRTLISLQEYVIASQKAPRIEHFRRQPDGSWLLRELRPGDRLVLDSVGCAIEVERVYRKVFDRPA